MSHVRKQIRDAVETTLRSGVSLVSRRVYGSRVYPLTKEKLPAIAVYTTSESSNIMTLGLRTLMRELSLNVDVYVSINDTFDDNVDAICLQIEEAIAANYTLGGLSKDTILVSTEVDYDGETENPVGVARLTYTVQYVTTVGDVETAR